MLLLMYHDVLDPDPRNDYLYRRGLPGFPPNRKVREGLDLGSFYPWLCVAFFMIIVGLFAVVIITDAGLTTMTDLDRTKQSLASIGTFHDEHIWSDAAWEANGYGEHVPDEGRHWIELHDDALVFDIEGNFLGLFVPERGAWFPKVKERPAPAAGPITYSVQEGR